MTDRDLLEAIYNDTQDLKQRVKGIETKVADIETRVTGIETKVADIETRVTGIETKVTGIQLTFEDEIRVNIKRVAEGHLDLARNLHDAMKPSSEVEVLSIRVGVLESDVKELKRKIS